MQSALVTTIAGSLSQSTRHTDGVGTAAFFYNPAGVAVDSAGNFAIVVRMRGVSVGRLGNKWDGLLEFRGCECGLSVALPHLLMMTWPPYTIASPLIQADYSNNLLRHINLTSGLVTTLAGGNTNGRADGIGTAATFNSPIGVAVDAAGATAIVVS